MEYKQIKEMNITDLYVFYIVLIYIYIYIYIYINYTTEYYCE